MLAYTCRAHPQGRGGPDPAGTGENTEGVTMNKVAYALIGIGAVVLVVWGVKEFFADPGVDLLIRIAVAAVGLGLLILIGMVARDRIRASKNDKFKGVQR
ncbi:MAG: hypothetical protein E4G93_00825 [Dehalococcoidia bacterium]|nr:MAG: hypothetical protein E4G93_00825 [Dehalococcoidia bacterium]